MWRKNQEPQTPAPVPAKNQPPKVEATKPLVNNPQSTAPEPVKAEFASSAPVVTAAVPVSAPIVAPPSPAPSNTAPVYSPAPLPANVDSRIGSGLKIRGEITGSSDMYIDGDVQGKIRVGSGRLTIGPNGRIQADLEAREIVVNGTVLGNLKASDRVQLGPSGSVQGGVVTPRIGIDDGARLRGNVETARAGEPSGTAKSNEKQDLRALVATKGE